MKIVRVGTFCFLLFLMTYPCVRSGFSVGDIPPIPTFGPPAKSATPKPSPAPAMPVAPPPTAPTPRLAQPPVVQPTRPVMTAPPVTRVTPAQPVAVVRPTLAVPAKTVSLSPAPSQVSAPASSPLQQSVALPPAQNTAQVQPSGAAQRQPQFMPMPTSMPASTPQMPTPVQTVPEPQEPEPMFEQPPSPQKPQEAVPQGEQTAPTIPQKKEEGPIVSKAETMSYPESEIGTHGNWVKKRKWLEQALAINNTIQQSIADIQRSRKAFYEKFTRVDKDLDAFYQSQGFEQGKVRNLFDEVREYIDSMRRQRIAKLQEEAELEDVSTTYSDYKIDEVEDEIGALKKDLEQLYLDLKAIEDIDKSLADRLKKVDEQIEMSLKEAEKAAQLTDKMWYIIDDKLAKNQYYQVKNLGERSKSILQYINVTLKGDFDSVVQRIKTQIERVKKGVGALESKGLILQNRARRLEQLRHEKALQETEEDVDLPKRKKRKEKAAKRPWYILPLIPFMAAASFIVTLISKFYDMLFGPSKPKSKKKKRKRLRQQQVIDMPVSQDLEPEEGGAEGDVQQKQEGETEDIDFTALSE